LDREATCDTLNACDFRATWIIILLKVFVTKWVVLRLPMSTKGELQHQKERLELLLNLTTKITSCLDLPEVLRAIAAQGWTDAPRRLQPEAASTSLNAR
jgi:hypothetical protein